jgi:hypothetical protein
MRRRVRRADDLRQLIMLGMSRLCFAVLILIAAAPLRAQAPPSSSGVDTLRSGNADLAVYAVALDSIYAKDWWPTDSMLVGLRTEVPQHFVLSRATRADSANFFSALAESFANDASLPRRLYAADQRPAVIVDSLPMKKRHALVDHATAPPRESAYPHSVRHPVHLSRVVYSADSQHAVLHVRLACPYLCARGDIVLLARRADRWVVIRIVNISIS